MVNKFFDSVVVLTTNRRERCEKELEKNGIEAKFFRSLNYHPAKSFNMSMYAIMERFLLTSASTMLILEDDVMFQHMDESKEVFEELDWLSWDIIYLGGNYVRHGDSKAATYVSKHVRRIYNAWATHAIGINRAVAKFIVSDYRKVQMFDAYLDERVLPRFKVLATVPMLAVQVPDYSTIWGRDVDYMDIWERSQAFIK